MVQIKTARELSVMKDACRISAEALRVAGEAIRPGVSTFEIDTIISATISRNRELLPRFSVTAVFPRVRVFP